MDVRFSPEQELLRASARDFLAAECPMGRVRTLFDDPRGVPDEVWKKMAELGWTGLPFGESHGGGGLGVLDLEVLMEEMGRALLPGPFFASVVLAGMAVEFGGSEEQKRLWLPGLASGTARATLALYEGGGRWDAGGVRLRARPGSGEYRLSGTKAFVPDAEGAEWMVVAARTGDAEEDVVLLVVDTRSAGLSIRPTRVVDLTRRYAEVTFDRVPVSTGRALGGGWETARRVLDHGRVALCAEMLGGAERVLEMSVAYARTREQFGRPIGSFQAIQHRCADMLVALEGARSATWYAAWALAAGEPDARSAACLAKAFVSDAYARIAGDGIQIHGGLGFTWDQDLHLYFRRAKTSEQLLGSPTWSRELAARHLIDPPH